MTLADQARRIPVLAAAENAITGLMTTERDLPIADYDSQTVTSIVGKLPEASQHELRMIGAYERTHKDRAGVREAVERLTAAKDM
jgi:hypothetical protein